MVPAGGAAQQLAYVGHSQGTTQLLAALAASPVLRPKLAIAALLAPAVHMRSIRSPPLQVLADLNADQARAAGGGELVCQQGLLLLVLLTCCAAFVQLFELLGQREFLPLVSAAADLFGELCSATPAACVSVITAICGYNPDNMNVTRWVAGAAAAVLGWTACCACAASLTLSSHLTRDLPHAPSRLPMMVQYAPSGTSVKNMEHWAQAIRRGHQQPLPRFQASGWSCS